MSVWDVLLLVEVARYGRLPLDGPHPNERCRSDQGVRANIRCKEVSTWDHLPGEAKQESLAGSIKVVG